MQNLVIGTLPDNKLIYENCVFVSPDKFTDFTKIPNLKIPFILINDIPFKIKSDKRVESGFICLNKLQRTFLKVSRGEKLENIKPLKDSNLSNETRNIISLNIEISVLNQIVLELKAKEISEYFTKNFSKLILVKNYPYIIDFKGTLLILKIVSLKLSSRKDSKEIEELEFIESENGILFKKSEISINVSKENPKGTSIKIKQDSEKRRNIFASNMSFEELGIGGLNKELSSIIRRVFVSRTFSPSMIEKLGLQHVKGLLLYGPPGTGKTLIARQIGVMLRCKSLKVVNGPEILNKYIGQSEENIRALFSEAEKDLEENAEEADLHIIIFDEIDAICKKRGTSVGGTGVNDSIVNQLLGKMDGINALTNILVIGMTNRKDIMDSALLRPGRFEVHIEIGLPEEKGRLEIFKIHAKKLIENKLLKEDVNFEKLAALTKNYSGAEIQGVVKCAISYASFESTDLLNSLKMSENDKSKIKLKNKEKQEREEKDEKIEVGMENFLAALEEVKPAFGAERTDLQNSLRRGFYFYSEIIQKKYENSLELIKRIKETEKSSLFSILIEGSSGSGTTAMACKIALEANFDYCKVISPNEFVGMSEISISNRINLIFEDSYKSSLSLIIIDQIERLLGYVSIGPHFLNNVLQTLLVLIKKFPPNIEGKKAKKLVIMGTTSEPKILSILGLKEVFNVVKDLSELNERKEFEFVIREDCKLEGEEDLNLILDSLEGSEIGVKKFLTLLEMAKDENEMISFNTFTQKRIEMGI